MSTTLENFGDPSREPTVDDYAAAIYRRRGMVVLVVLSSAIAAGLLSNAIQPRYEAKTEFYVTQDAVVPAVGPERGSLRVPLAIELAEAHGKLLEGADLRRAVARKFPEKSEHDLIRDVDVALSPSGLIRVYARDTDPQRAAELATSFVEQLRTFHREQLQQTLEQDIFNVRQEMKKLEAEKEALEDARWTYVEAQGISSLSTAVVDLEAQRLRYEERLREARVESEAAVARVAAVDSELERQKRVSKSLEVSSQVVDPLYINAHKLLTAARVAAEVAAARLDALRAKQSEIDAQIRALPAQLSRTERFNDDLARLVGSIQRLRDAENTMNGELLTVPDPMVVIEEAAVPNSPVFPILGLNIAIAAFGGLILGVLYSLLLDHLDRRALDRRIEELRRQEWAMEVLNAFSSRNAKS